MSKKIWPCEATALISLCILCLTASPALSSVAVAESVSQAPDEEVLGLSVTTSGGDSVEFRVVAHFGSETEELARGATPWQGTLPLAGTSYEHLRIEAEGYWAADMALPVATHPMSVELVPGTLLLATVDTPQTDPAPSRVFVEVAFASRSEAMAVAVGGPRGTFCAVHEKRLSCPIPTGNLDICLRIPSLSGHCLWNLTPEPGKPVDLGRLEFVAGASLYGHLDATDPTVELAGTTIALTPRMAAASPNPASSHRRRILGMKVRSDERGRFVASGLAPGEYQVLALKPGYFGVAQRVEVRADTSEVHLAEPLLLESPVALEVELEPALDPWQRPWSLKLTRSTESLNVFETVEEKSADSTGRWRVDGISPGPYRVRVRDSSGSTWKTHDWDLRAGDQRRFSSIDLVPVRGRLTAGGDGLAAEIVFGTTQGIVQVTLKSDEDGHFEGALPHEGLWGVDLRIGRDWGSQGLEPIEVVRRSGKSYARVDIELPDTELNGQVTYRGEPTKAWVLAFREQRSDSGMTFRRREIVLQTDEDGQFLVRGIAAGPITIQAYNHLASSPWRSVHLEEDAEMDPLSLEMEEIRRVRGRLLGPQGGVSGARLEARPSHGLQRTLASEVNGGFELRLDGDAVFVDFFVFPPGGGFFFQREPIPAEATRDLVLSMPTASGDIVLPSLAPDRWLRFNELGVSIGDLRRWVLEDGRVSGHWTGGYRLSNAAVGKWSYCPEGSSSCQEGYLSAGGEILFEESREELVEKGREDATSH